MGAYVLLSSFKLKLSIVFCMVFFYLSSYSSVSTLRTYNLNKYPTKPFAFDYVQSERLNITLPMQITICHRSKPTVTQSRTWSNVFIGNVDRNGTHVQDGIDFAVWASGVWVGAWNKGNTLWATFGKGEGFDLLVWRHTCLAINFESGYSILTENGKVQIIKLR